MPSVEDTYDRQLIEQLYTAYEKKLYLLAYGIVKNHHDAQDCVQDTFASVARHMAQYRERSAESRVYLLRVTCRNIAIDRYRRNGRVASVLLADGEGTECPLADPDTDLLSELIGKLTHETLVSLLRSLPPPCREVIVLRYYEEMSTAEIAAHLGITARTVRNRLQKAYEMIRTKGGEELHELYRHNASK